jgi:hypothetical protein
MISFPDDNDETSCGMNAKNKSCESGFSVFRKAAMSYLCPSTPGPDAEEGCRTHGSMGKGMTNDKL